MHPRSHREVDTAMRKGFVFSDEHQVVSPERLAEVRSRRSVCSAQEVQLIPWAVRRYWLKNL